MPWYSLIDKPGQQQKKKEKMTQLGGHLMQALSRDQVQVYHHIKFSFHSGFSATEQTLNKSSNRVSLNGNIT